VTDRARSHEAQASKSVQKNKFMSDDTFFLAKTWKKNFIFKSVLSVIVFRALSVTVLRALSVTVLRALSVTVLRTL